MKKLWQLFKPTPIVSRTEAYLIAKNECEKRGWSWREPIKIWHQRRCWVVFTNYDCRGANVRIKVNSNTGQIIETAYMPR